MARRRVYRHDVRGPECGSNWMRQNGFTNGRQAYRGGAVFSGRWRGCAPGCAYRRPGPAVKEQGIALYVEGNSLSAIGRLLGYTPAAVLGWVKKGGAPR